MGIGGCFARCYVKSVSEGLCGNSKFQSHALSVMKTASDCFQQSRRESGHSAIQKLASSKSDDV